VAGYTIKNLKADVEDVAPRFGLSPGLESRFAREALECEKSGVSYLRIAPGSRIPFGHRHTVQEEVYVLVSGSGRVKLDDEVRELRQWDVVRVAPETMRAFEAGPDGIELLAFGAPAGGGAGQDAEIVQGWWGGS
jgi:mannose-6-phosphate isomerase-like protein (cupin superfamily)